MNDSGEIIESLELGGVKCESIRYLKSEIEENEILQMELQELGMTLVGTGMNDKSGTYNNNGLNAMQCDLNTIGSNKSDSLMLKYVSTLKELKNHLFDNDGERHCIRTNLRENVVLPETKQLQKFYQKTVRNYVRHINAWQRIRLHLCHGFSDHSGTWSVKKNQKQVTLFFLLCLYVCCVVFLLFFLGVLFCIVWFEKVRQK